MFMPLQFPMSIRLEFISYLTSHGFIIVIDGLNIGEWKFSLFHYFNTNIILNTLILCNV